MVIEFLSTFLAISGIWIISAAWKFLNRTWFTPKKIEKFLRDQGINGTTYNFFNENASTTSMEVEFKPTIELSHQIVPRVMPSVLQTLEKYGKVSLSWVGSLPVVTILDVGMVREVLTNTSGYIETEEIPSLMKLPATGFPSYFGEKWAKHRRIASPAFHKEQLRLMLPAFDKCCREMVEKWQNLTSIGSTELDVVSEIKNLAADVITRATFGSNYEEGRRVYQLQTKQSQHFMEAMQALHMPCFGYLATKRMKRMKQIFREVQSLLRDVIKKREVAIKTGETYEDDLLGALMESNFKEVSNHGNSKSAGLTTDEIIEECKAFYLGGQDAISSLLIWTMIVLSMHPDWQEKAREEVMHTFGRNAPYFDGLNQMKIVMMILNEVLRLYSPFISLTRIPLEKVKLREIILPAGVQILIPTLLIHHDHELWGEDAGEFKPERFSEGVARATNNQLSFFPFGWGPRICSGQSFAIIEAKMCIAIILQQFSFKLSSQYAHAPTSNAQNILVPQHGAKLILHKL